MIGRTPGRTRPITRARSLLFVLATAIAPGCTNDAELVVRRLRQPGIPLAGLEVTALPVDPDALLDSLAAAARRPKPVFAGLEREMASFRADDTPDTTGSARAIRAWDATRDSVETLADTLRAMDRASLAYREAYARLRGLYERLGQRAGERDRAVQGGLGRERDLAQRVARAADSLRRWEQVAYADFPDRLETAVRQSGRDVRQIPTDSSGVAHFTLPPGRWWIQARVRDPHNPFLERYWNFPVTLTGLVAVAVPLLDRTAIIRWRH